MQFLHTFLSKANLVGVGGDSFLHNLPCHFHDLIRSFPESANQPPMQRSNRNCSIPTSIRSWNSFVCDRKVTATQNLQHQYFRYEGHKLIDSNSNLLTYQVQIKL